MGAARQQEALVTDQFGPQAAAYVASPVHARGEDLDRITALAKAVRPARALDMGCGGGHVAFALAPFAGEVTAYDLSEAMLGAVAAEAQRRGLGNIVVHQGAAERLPFADGTFDLVATRFSTHHWTDAAAGIREARRVVRAGARAVFADAYAPEDALLDTAMQTLEMLRDPSHVRDYTLGQWRTMIEAAGFRLDETATFRLRLDFASWIARINTPAELVAAIRSLQGRLAEPVRRHFAIEADGSLTIDTMVMTATAA